MLGTKLCYDTAYHPQSDGQSERLNRWLEQYLRCMAGHKQSQWAKWLPSAKFWYNTSYHSAIKMSPFQALYGYSTPQFPRYHSQTSNVAAVDEWLKQHEDILKLLREFAYSSTQDETKCR